MKTALITLGCAALAMSSLPTSAAVQVTEQEAAKPPAEDHAEMARTRILGQRELPKVLTIVPWKKPQAGAAATRPLASVLDEALTPVDRDVLRRELGYHAQLRTRAEVAASATAEPAMPATNTKP
jgi:hypothetical protein